MNKKDRMIFVRKTLGLTQTQFSNLIGKSLSTVSKWETGKCDITINKNVRHWLTVIGINCDYIENGDCDMLLENVKITDVLSNVKEALND